MGIRGSDCYSERVVNECFLGNVLCWFSMTETSLMDKIIDVCLRRAIVYPTAEIYGGSSGFFEMGPIGFRIAQRIKDFWRETFVRDTANVHEVSGRTILPKRVLEASGHVGGFTDPLIQCKKCKSMFRVDQLLSEVAASSFEGLELVEYDAAVKEHNIQCSRCKSQNWEPARAFNLMFSTEIGAAGGQTGLLRPETAQNMFTAFRRITHAMRCKLPFGIAQIGTSYRNEIAPRHFMLRSREFTQMEVEMFAAPDEMNSFPQFTEVASTELPIITREMQDKGETTPVLMTAEQAVTDGIVPNEVMAYFLALEAEMLHAFGVKQDAFWFRHMLPEETPHYSGGNFDLEIRADHGVVEMAGNAYRQAYDLTKHAKGSNTKLQIRHNDQNIVPHVVEPSIGVERTLYTVLESNYREGDRDWAWFAFPPVIAPYDIAVFPLRRKDEQIGLAMEIAEDLHQQGLETLYDETGQIGKRYARADEIGVPFCMTIDPDSDANGTVTIRDRDTMHQIRLPISEVNEVMERLLTEEAFADLEKEYPISKSQ